MTCHRTPTLKKKLEPKPESRAAKVEGKRFRKAYLSILTRKTRGLKGKYEKHQNLERKNPRIAVPKGEDKVHPYSQLPVEIGCFFLFSKFQAKLLLPSSS
jgi:hypothetical protein